MCVVVCSTITLCKMKIFQVVFLLDLDSISEDSVGEDTLTLETRTLREVLLKFLTFFATEHCASDRNAAFNLKWDCKYYNSSGNKSVRQRRDFKDFNLVNFEKFENELEDKLKKCKLQGQAGQLHQQTTSSVDNCSTSKLGQNDKCLSKQASSCRRSKLPSFQTRICNLELALKDLVCDYTWDQPYVCSPLRKTKRQHKNREPSRKSNESDTNGEVENIVIVITGVPRLHKDLEGLTDGKRGLTYSVLLDKILPPSLYKQFVQISKIRLFWLDPSDVIINGSTNETESREARAIFELFHQALRKTRGGLIPSNAILPRRNTDNEPSSSKKHIPEGLAIQIPVSALMTGYLLDERAVSHKQLPVHKCSHLHLNLGSGGSMPIVCDLELLPLFKSNISNSENNVLSSNNSESFRISDTKKIVKEKRTLNCKTVEPAKHFTVKCSATNKETGLNYVPRDIHIIGTTLLDEIHSQLIAKPLVYICFSVDHLAAKNHSNEDSLSLQQILIELSSNRTALLVSCDDLCQGIFFPSNNRCEIALLYILASEGETSVFTLKVGPASIPKDVNVLIQKSLETCTNFSPEKRIPKTFSRHEYAALSPSFLEKWFITHPCHKNTLSEIKFTSPPSSLHIAQKKIFKRLQQAYLPSLMNLKQQKSPSASSESISSDQLRRSPRLRRDSQQNGKRHKAVTRSLSNQICESQNDNSECNSSHSQGVKPNLKKRTTILNKELSASGMCDQANENDMLTNLQAIYKNAMYGDSSVLSIAQTVIDVCLMFYKNQDRINAKMCTRDAISKQFLLKPGDVDCSNCSKETVKKWKIREHCFQSVIRLELTAIDPSKTEEYVSEITSHLRKLSFIAGPSSLSSFLQETLVENYYAQLKEAVAEICEDLNQPLPNEDDESLPSSSNDGLPSPDKPESIPASMLSQMSSISSSSNQSRTFRTKRSEAVTRYPSFGDVAHKRKIVIPQVPSKPRSLLMASNSGPLTRSAQKRLQEKSTESKSAPRNVRRTLFKHGIPTTRRHTTPPKPRKPTTPKGRHVLRTRNVADTPIHKQVDKPTLHRQSLKRKRTLDSDSLEDEIVEESPDKQPDPSYIPRQSPKRQHSSLQREASFYSACPESKTEIAMVSNVITTKTPLRRSARKLVQLACPEITPDRKLKAKRVLMLGATPDKNTTPKKGFKGIYSQICSRRSDRLSNTVEGPIHPKAPTQATSLSPRTRQKEETKHTSTGSCRKSPRLSFKEATVNKHEAHGMLKNPKVSRKLLQTPLKSESKPASQTPTTRSITSSMCNEDRVISTPTRNGLDSPEASPHHVFFYGPLAGNLEDTLSRSSSPIIPLLSNDMGEFYEDQNRCASLETPFNAAVASICDEVHTCPDTDVNFRQYFSTNDVQMSSTATISDAVVPSEMLAPENTNFMFTPTKTYSTGILGSPECALPPWEVENDFNVAFGLLSKHTLDNQDSVHKKTDSLETIQFSSTETCSLNFDNGFSPRPNDTGGNMAKTRTSSSSSDCYSLQRFTRQASKELGISLKEFKKLTSEFVSLENSKEADQTPIKGKSATEISKVQGANSFSPSKRSRPVIRSKFTPPTDRTLFHLTNSPILSSVSTRTRRHSLKDRTQ